MDPLGAEFRTCEAGDGKIGPNDLAVLTHRIEEQPDVAGIGVTRILAGGFFHQRCPFPPDHEVTSSGRLRDLLATP
jgi:hypothetical protein